MDEPWRTRFLAAKDGDERRAVIKEWRTWQKVERRLSREVTKLMAEEPGIVWQQTRRKPK